MRLIDADALRELVRSKSNDPEDLWDTMGVLNAINNTPTVVQVLSLDNITEEDIEKFKTMWQRANNKGLPTIYEDRPSGEWILRDVNYDDGGNNRYECSECHYADIHSGSTEVPYCWHCGAEMKSGQEV